MWCRHGHRRNTFPGLLACAWMASICYPACGQWELPVPLELTGTSSTDRQVTGLADPLDARDAMNLDATRTLATMMTTVSGSTAIIGALTPAPSAYSVGMVVVVVPVEPNEAGATLELNGLGPKFMVKTGGVPLAAGDLRANVPSRFIYDGERFQLISSTPLPCPAGFSSAGRSFCIADGTLAAANFFNAISGCASLGARLCTISEWSHACFRLPGFLATVTEPEWVDHAANGNTGAKLVGVGIDGDQPVLGTGCNFGGQDLPTMPHTYRCCSTR